MIIPNKELFDPTVFKINADMVYETVDTSVSAVTVIDNFYEDIDSVLEQIDKLSMTKIWRVQPDNNRTYFDGRKVYANNMPGSELQYTQDNILITKFAEIDNYDIERISFPTVLTVNCFTFTDDLNLEDNYYGAHVDLLVNSDAKDQLAAVIFLNRHYEEGEGMNFYRDLVDYDENHMIPKDDMDVVKTVQGKCNRAVLFNSRFPHGQHTPTDQFKKEMRYTQVIFVSLW